MITLSIRPQDGLHQPPGLMFDTIIRKLSQSVITGAHLARDHFHPSRQSTHMHTAACEHTAGRSHLWLTCWTRQWPGGVVRQGRKEGGGRDGG